MVHWLHFSVSNIPPRCVIMIYLGTLILGSVFSDQSTQISNPKVNKTVKHNQAETDKPSDFIAVMYTQTVQ